MEVKEGNATDDALMVDQGASFIIDTQRYLYYILYVQESSHTI
jgi:hypothetical protein